MGKYKGTPEERKSSRLRNLKRRVPEFRGLENWQVEARIELLKEQHGNSCAICDRKAGEGEELDVDHCGVTGLVRGLLCRNHNHLIGKAHDDVRVLDRAKRYLAGFLSRLPVTGVSIETPQE